MEYIGKAFHFKTPILPDGLVVIEAENSSGKSTFADMIYFGLGGYVPQFSREGPQLHKEILGDSPNSARITIQVNEQQFVLTRRFDAPQEIVVSPLAGDQSESFPISRKAGSRIFSDWLLDQLGITPVTLFAGTYSGKLNITDLFRLIYHDQDPDPSRVFKKLVRENFVSDSRDFRRAIFEILVGQASEKYYEMLGKLRQAETSLTELRAVLRTYRTASSHASSNADDENEVFLKKSLTEKEEQLHRLESTRRTMRRESPNSPAPVTDLILARNELARLELKIANSEGRITSTTVEYARLSDLRTQLIEEVVRIRKIIHAHETLALFSPDTCPCCLRKVDRPIGKCICGQAIDEAAYQRFFYSSEEYLAILKSKQKNVETVEAAMKDCEQERASALEEVRIDNEARDRARESVSKWGGTDGDYTTALESLDDRIVDLRVSIESLTKRLELETNRTKLEGEVDAARRKVDALQNQTDLEEVTAQQDREAKIARFSDLYTQLLKTTLPNVRIARLDQNYDPVINNSEYREASASVSRRLMYYLALLWMSLEDPTIPYPRFLLVDTPETAGIDRENLKAVLSQIPRVLADGKGELAQVILTTGVGKAPDSGTRFLSLSKSTRLLAPRAQ